MAKKSTRRKVKVIGTQEYINKDTGEVEEMQVTNIEERDANFHKLWLGHIIDALDLVGNKKLKVVTFIMQNLTSENLFLMTQRELSEKLGVSLQTIQATIRALQEADFLKIIRNGTYQVNPDVIFKGGKGQRLNVLIKYKDLNIKAKEQPPQEENEPLPGQTTIGDTKEA